MMVPPPFPSTTGPKVIARKVGCVGKALRSSRGSHCSKRWPPRVKIAGCQSKRRRQSLKLLVRQALRILCRIEGSLHDH